MLLKLGSYRGAAKFKAGRRSMLKKFPPPTSFFHVLIVCSADPPCPQFLASCVGFLFYLGLSSHGEPQDGRDAGKVENPSLSRALASLSLKSPLLRELACVSPCLGILRSMCHLSVNYKHCCPFLLELLPGADVSCHTPSVAKLRTTCTTKHVLSAPQF